MTDEIIGMDDMMAIYAVTDRFGIERESIRVPLEKADTGAVVRQPDGGVEITVPATTAIQEWLPLLQDQLERLGFALQYNNDDEV